MNSLCVLVLDKHAFIVQDFTEDVGAEAVRNQSQLERAGVSVVTERGEIYAVVGVEVVALTFLVKCERHSTRQRDRRAERRGVVLVDRRDGIVDIFHAVFNLVSHPK